MAKMRKCLCDGTEYSYCRSCTKDRNRPLWSTLYCSENCRNIFETLNEYNFNHITEDEARELLKDCDLSNRDNFSEGVKKDIEKFYPSEKKVEINVEPTEIEVSEPTFEKPTKASKKVKFN